MFRLYVIDDAYAIAIHMPAQTADSSALVRIYFHCCCGVLFTFVAYFAYIFRDIVTNLHSLSHVANAMQNCVRVLSSRNSNENEV